MRGTARRRFTNAVFFHYSAPMTGLDWISFRCRRRCAAYRSFAWDVVFFLSLSLSTFHWITIAFGIAVDQSVRFNEWSGDLAEDGLERGRGRGAGGGHRLVVHIIESSSPAGIWGHSRGKSCGSTQPQNETGKSDRNEIIRQSEYDLVRKKITPTRKGWKNEVTREKVFSVKTWWRSSWADSIPNRGRHMGRTSGPE